MSDEFMKIATQEINDELSSISKILDSCQNDEALSISIEQMKITMDKPHDLGEIQKQISDIASKIVD